MTEDEIAALTDAEVVALVERLQAEHARRWTAAHADALIDQAVTAVLESEGEAPGDPWVRRQRGYPRGWQVTHGGKRWESLIPNNVREPGDPSDPQAARWWRNLSDALPEGTWDPNGRAYKVGDQVTYNGVRYRVRQAHTSQADWAPPNVPALYQPIGA